MLQVSLSIFCRAINNLFVIASPEDYDLVKQSCRLPRTTVLLQEEVVKELSENKPITKDYNGWFKQQFIKLAAYKLIRDDYYLVLDADVIATKYIAEGDLFYDGKARIKRYEAPIDNEWYEWAGRVLKTKPCKYRFSLTPGLLHTGCVNRLAAHLEDLSGQVWTRYLMDNFPWTEYSLYYSFLNNAGLLTDYYHLDKQDICNNCVWFREEWDSWKPSNSFGKYPFTVIQSNTGLTTEKIWAKVAPYMRPL